MCLKIFIYIIIILIGGDSALEQLCGTENTTNKCLCGYEANKNTILEYAADCSRIYLDYMPDIKQLPSNVESLDISYNQITSLDFDKSDFETNTLKYLKAAHNRITYISDEFLRNIPNLKHLDVSHNMITDIKITIFAGVPKLHNLDLSYNQLEIIPDNIFGSLKLLKDLELSYNNVGGALMKHDNLNITGLDANATHLKMDYTNISKVSSSFFEGYSLTHLSMADNYLEVIPEIPYTLEYVDLSGNYFKSLAVRYLNYHNIKILKLNRLHSLEKIEKYAFYNLQVLESLSLEHSVKLKEFNHLAFGVLQNDEVWSLKKLSLAGSGITSLNSSYSKLFSALDKINLANNPWECDCDILWLQMFHGKLSHKTEMRCAFPPKLRHKKILELSGTDLPKCVAGSGWKTHSILVSIISVLVIVLVGIILYLIYMGPFIHKNNSRGLSPQSPYSFVVTEESHNTIN